MKFEIFDYYAKSNYEYLHGNGKEATYHLICKLPIQEGSKILEIGFGIGSSLMTISKNFPHTILFGIEHSPKMYARANFRKRLLREKNVTFSLSEMDNIPFEDHYFNIIYAESVLGILPLEQINKLLFEISSKLEKGGTFAINETIWKENVENKTIEEFNAFSQKNFGFPTANEYIKYTSQWITHIESFGFQNIYNSSSVFNESENLKDFKNYKLKIYDIGMKIIRLFRPLKLKYKKPNKFKHSKLLESRILIFRKTSKT